MSSNTPVVPGGASRSLPANASLEHERKRAKALLPQLRRDNPKARLADAQFTVARELGFASWPRLVHYFRTLERDAHALHVVEGYESDYYEGRVRSLLAEHRRGREWAGRVLAAFVPRLYGRSIADVLALQVTTDDARLAVARQHRCSSWDQLVSEAAAERARTSDPWARQKLPFLRAARAIRDSDLDALQTIVEQHPELLHPSEDHERRGQSLIFAALTAERRQRTPEAHRVTQWLASHGMNLAHALNLMLLGFHGMTAQEVQYLLDRGADPKWVPPNGVSVLEHVLLKHATSEAIDLIAKYAVRRDAFWISAGLGDVDGVRRYFGRDGKLVAAAYKNRPPLGLMPVVMPSLPEADDLEILAETAMVAAINGRVAVIEVLIDRGFPIDYAGWGGTSLLRFAIGQRNLPMIEMLLKLGADLDTKGEQPHASARELARQTAALFPDRPEMRTILRLCDAGTLEEALAEAERQRPSPPPLAPKLQAVFELAGDDAARRGQTEIRGENLFIGLLRGPRLLLRFLSGSGVNLDKLQEAVSDRLHPADDRVTRPKLPFDEEVKGVIERAIAIGDERRREVVTSFQVLAALVERQSGFAADLIVACGGDLARLREKLVQS